MRELQIPRVTVLMPVYNGESYLLRAAESILEQSFQDFELLIINDGSTDGTTEILATLKARDSRVRTIAKENGGIVSALNLGLEQARGEYIARMDADDISTQKRLATQVEFLDKNEAVVACGTFFEKIGAATGMVKMPISSGQCKAMLLIAPCFAHPTVMMRKKVIKKNNLTYSNQYLYAEDYKLWSELGKFGELVNIPDPLIQYRIHHAQTGKSKAEKQKAAHILVATENLRNVGIEFPNNTLRGMLWPERLGPLGAIAYVRQSLRLVKILRKNNIVGVWYLISVLARNTVIYSIKATLFRPV